MEIIGDIFENIGDGINKIKDILFSFYDLFNKVIDYLPYPFNNIIRYFIVVIIIVIIVKAVGHLL